MKEIVLKFNKKNNFCPVAKKYHIKGKHEELIKETSWVVRNFYASIVNAYGKGAPRLIEAEQLAEDLFKQIKKQTPKKYKDIAEKYCNL